MMMATHVVSRICVIDTLLGRDLRGTGRGLILTLSCCLEELSEVTRNLIPGKRIGADI